jgi:hypothetical protein
MRTVTFSNPRVAERVNSSFVPVWYNRGPGFHNCEKRTENWIFSAHADCYPTKNICTFFLTPELDVVYYVAGYFAPDLFLEILEDVLRIQKAPDRSDHHREVARGLTARLEELRKIRPDAPPEAGLERYGPCRYEKTEHRHTPDCRRVLAEALEYRRKVHESIAPEGRLAFARVQHDYLFGNPFSEEAPRDPVPTGIVRPQAPALPPVATAGLREKK